MIYFKRNLRGWERTVRVVAGLALIGVTTLFANTAWMIWAGMIGGAVFAGTGFVGFRPMCALVGRRLVENRT